MPGWADSNSRCRSTRASRLVNISSRVNLVDYVVDLVENFAVAIHDDSDNLVSERQRIRDTDDARGLGREIMYVDDLQASGLKTLSDFGTTGIDGDAIFSHDHIHTRSGSDQSRHLWHNALLAMIYTQKKMYD